MSIAELIDQMDEVFGMEEPEVAVEYWDAEDGRWLLSDER